MRKFSVFALFLLLLLLSSWLTLRFGETPFEIVWEGAKQRLLLGHTGWNPLLDERVPRLIVILCTGASLAVSGAVMQALFQNPLASPSVLGISCGGSLFVVLIFASGWNIHYPFAVPVAAFSGCLCTLMLVYAISRLQGGMQMQMLILSGIAISSLILALQGALTYSLRDRWQLIQTLTEWEAGSTTDRNWQHVHMQLPLTIVGLIGCWFYTKEIDILALGEEEAANLGVDVRTVRWRLFLCIALLTGGAIAAVGIIAFFGLVLPHLMRYLSGPNARRLIPLCLLAGSTTLACLDISLRVFEIQAFSIGNVSAILGAFFFVMLLFGTGKKGLSPC